MDEENTTLKAEVTPRRDNHTMQHAAPVLLTASKNEKAKVLSAMLDARSGVREAELHRCDLRFAMDCGYTQDFYRTKSAFGKNLIVRNFESAETESQVIIARLNQQLLEVQSLADSVQEQLASSYAAANIERENLNWRIAEVEVEVEDSRVGLEREVNSARELIASGERTRTNKDAKLSPHRNSHSCTSA